MDSLELIRNFLSERLGVEPERVREDAVLADLGVDSLMVAELMFEAEDRLNIDINNDEPVPVTVGDMRAIIERVLAASNAEG
ncbi:acyl carrier protein [Oryzisolibacter propanilivorax]|uniref:Acyl carrier protein n=1 Tax=Oryzisolibacter propanilivorax TaxID=1527607 RepID=A0A1G9QET0_9BURK|nr:acyl carrier protein [Oryzisolibacter propanilivorax]SDM09483.1 acyl carrier protein [Oryzisolibacter propanilivorax]